VSFDLWWVSEVGRPPADERESYAFRLAREAWNRSERETLESLRDETCGDCAAKRPLSPGLPEHPGYHRDGPDDKYPDRCQATRIRRRLANLPTTPKATTARRPHE